MGNHEVFMQRTLELAKLGWGKTNPNPLVGCIIVKNGEIISEGYHALIGTDHAEISAFKNAKADVSGATLYVNLEPCSHFGRTPPCANAIVEKGIKKVVIAMVDPNPKVAGNGVKILRDAGIIVEIGVLEEEAKKLNEIFIKYITFKTPFVIMKYAMTLDGKIASCIGDAKWISCEESRKVSHNLRQRVSSIMVGKNTVLRDNPSLNTRLDGQNSNDPIRIIVDSNGELPLDRKVFNFTDSNAYTILATTSKISNEKEKMFLDKGVKILKCENKLNKVDLSLLMQELYKLEIDSVLIEGGGILNASAIEQNIVDKAMVFIAPKIIGGKNSIIPVAGDGIKLMEDAIKLKDFSSTMCGNDILIEGYFR